jgi:hypothetical protein
MPPEDYYEKKFDKIVDSYLEMMSDLEKVKKIDKERSIKYLALSALDYFNKFPN